MSIKRSEFAFERDFTRIPNAWVRDARLSRRARGMLAELMSHRPGWKVTIGGLVSTGTEGRDAVRAAVSELAEAGYLRRTQTHGERGRFNEIDYELCEPPVGHSTVVGFTDDGSTDSGSADVGSAPTKKTSSSEDHSTEDERSPFCAKHPNGSGGVPCGPCRDARLLHEKGLRTMQTPIPPRRIEIVSKMCSEPGHEEYPRHPSCALCDRLAAESEVRRVG